MSQQTVPPGQGGGSKRRASTTVEVRQSKRLRQTEEVDEEDEADDDGSDIDNVSTPSNLSEGDFDDNLFEKRPKEAEADSKSLRKPKFCILNAVLEHPHLALAVTRLVHPKTMLTLYSISKAFHHNMDGTFMSFIKANAEVWAPWGHICFPFQCFRRLCIADPAGRRMERDDSRVRHVPGFRWLQMIVFRHFTSTKILQALDAAGHRLPNYTIIAVQRVWFTMSFPSNAARIGLTHNREYWGNTDIYVATQFFVKIDMFFTDPVHGKGEIILRKIFLSQQSLVPLFRLLCGRMNLIEILQYYVIYNYRPDPRYANNSLFGVPTHMLGIGIREAWGMGHRRMFRVDQCVVRESMRRGYLLSNWYLDMVCFGYQQESDNTPVEGPGGKPRVFAPLATLPQDQFWTKAEKSLPGINQAFKGLNLK
jgi:hypothetical protein